MFNKSDIKRNEFQLFGKQGKKGYDWWWHSFTAINHKTGEEKPFYIEFFLCNPKLAPCPVPGVVPHRESKAPPLPTVRRRFPMYGYACQFLAFLL